MSCAPGPIFTPGPLLAQTILENEFKPRSFLFQFPLIYILILPPIRFGSLIGQASQRERREGERMLGRVRRSTISSLEQLELERPSSSKLIKADSLSIYESTLMKLREGSQRDTSFPAECSVDGHGRCNTSDGSPREEASITGMDSSSECIEDTSGCQPTGSSRETKKNNSLAYMFSRYKSSLCAGATPDEDAMVIEDGIRLANSSLSPDNYQMMSSSVQSTIGEPICSPMI